MRNASRTRSPSRADDAELEERITDSIETHPHFWGALIQVEVAQGVATLTGIVRHPADRQRADLLARAHGARGVNNRLLLESDINRQTT